MLQIVPKKKKNEKEIRKVLHIKFIQIRKLTKASTTYFQSPSMCCFLQFLFFSSKFPQIFVTHAFFKNVINQKRKAQLYITRA